MVSGLSHLVKSFYFFFFLVCCYGTLQCSFLPDGRRVNRLRMELELKRSLADITGAACSSNTPLLMSCALKILGGTIKRW